MYGSIRAKGAGVLVQCFSTDGPQPRYRALASIIPGRERFSWN